MQAGFKQFVIVVQASFFRVEKDEVLLERAESAKVAAVVVGRRPLQDAPADIVGDVCQGQFSYIPAEGGAVCRVVQNIYLNLGDSY